MLTSYLCQVVVRLESTTTTEILTTALGLFNSSLFPYTPSQAFPSELVRLLTRL